MRHGGAPRNLCGGVIGVSTCEALRGCGTGLREKNMSIPRDFYAQRTPDRPLNFSFLPRHNKCEERGSRVTMWHV